MRNQIWPAVLLTCSFILLPASAQNGQWITWGHDPQRSSWSTDEHAFSTDNVGQLGLLWKTTVPNQPLSMNGLTAPLMIRSVRTKSGLRNLVVVAGSGDLVYALDAENGELVWKADVGGEEQMPGPPSWLCPNALNDTPTIDPVKQRVFVIAADGRLHTLALADGHVLMPATRFVPPFSKNWSLNYSGGVLYTSISQDCNNIRSGIAALAPDAPGRPVNTFYSSGACGKSFCGAGIWGRGGPTVDFTGFVYGSTGDAQFDPAANMFGDTILKLAPGSLRLAGYYTPSTWDYLTRKDLDMSTSTPVIFRWKQRVLTAVGGKEGAIYVADAAKMSGPNHHAAEYISPRYSNARQTFEANGIWGAMSVWHDAAGGTWLYVPTWGLPTPAAQFPQEHGPVKMGSIMAFNVVAGSKGGPTLKPAWISQDIAVPDPVAIAGGVAFVVGTGENPEQVHNGDINQLLENRESRNTGHAILYALDARSGRELWSSRNTMTTWTHFSGLAIGDGKIFATTHDGTVYAFALRGPNAAEAHVTVVPGAAPNRIPPPKPVAAASAAPSSPVPQCGEASEVFVKRCAGCHSADGRGVTARHTPNFTDPTWQQSKTDADLLDAIKNGTQSGMPGFGDQLTAEQLTHLVSCVVRGFAPATQGR